MDNNYNIIISRRATVEILTNIKYFKRIDLKLAKIFINKFDKEIDKLKNIKKRKLIENLNINNNHYYKHYLKFFDGKNYLIVYQVKDNKIFLDYFRECDDSINID